MVGLGIELEILQRDGIQPVYRDDVVREGLAADAPAFRKAGNGVVDLVIGANAQQLRKVSTAFRRSGGRVRAWIRNRILDPFVSEKEQHFVAAVEKFGYRDRTADGPAVLIIAGHLFLKPGEIREKRRRRQSGNLIEFVQRSVKTICSSLHNDVDRAAAGMPVGSVGGEGHHLHFGNGVHGRIIGDAIVARGVGRAIEQEVVAAARRASYGEVGRTGIIERPVELRVASWNHAVRQLRQDQRSAAGHGHILNLPGADHLAHRCGCSLKHGRVRIHGHRFRDLANFQCEV